jgi:hypothetical protein
MQPNCQLCVGFTRQMRTVTPGPEAAPPLAADLRVLPECSQTRGLSPPSTAQYTNNSRAT